MSTVCKTRWRWLGQLFGLITGILVFEKPNPVTIGLLVVAVLLVLWTQWGSSHD